MNINTLGQSSLALDSSDGGGTSRNGASSSAVTTPPFDEIYCPIYELFNEPLEICNSNNEYIIHCCGNFRQKKLCFKKRRRKIPSSTASLQAHRLDHHPRTQMKIPVKLI